MSDPTLISAHMVKELYEIMKRRRAEIKVRNLSEIDDNVTINISNCSRASTIATPPPMTIALHDKANIIPKLRR